MAVIIFLIILSALVIVHEVGHYSVAKYFGIRVDEFGLGYPPKAKKLFRWRDTDFTLNWLPFGGFVKIFGENPEEAQASLANSSDAALGGHGQNLLHKPALPSDSFQAKNRGIQAAVLFAGVFFNFVFAWLLISLGLMIGLPAPAGISLPVENPQTVITMVLPGSPAHDAGLRSGDVVAGYTPESASELISSATGPIILDIRRGEGAEKITVVPREGILPEQKAIGISMETIGTVELPIHKAFFYGAKITWELTVETARALGKFIWQAAIGKGDLSAVTGPVGLVGMVGEVKDLGFGYLISFTALISLNLFLINLLPFPALDGGRLVFVGIEALTRRTVPARLFNAVNAAGFALLIFLMILITIRDVRNIL